MQKAERLVRLFKKKRSHDQEQESAHNILWNQMDIAPLLLVKEGIRKRLIPLESVPSHNRHSFEFISNSVKLRGEWKERSEGSSVLSFTLENLSSASFRLARLVFPAENGLDKFIEQIDTPNISFLRNGYQSWSTARSYRYKEKPLRPWLKLVSLASSNMSNLPSNVPGILSSDMYSVIGDSATGESFFIGQGPGFNQFVYIHLHLYLKEMKKSYFEVTYDFGRQYLAPGGKMELDCLYLHSGKNQAVLERYFSFVKESMKIPIPDHNSRGWCTWYCYFTKISPEVVLSNLKIIKEKDLPIDYVLIDDGYEKRVGDWLDLKPGFENKMSEITSAVKDAGYKPGIWIAPFVAEKGSELITGHPDYILKNEQGRSLKAGYNVFWKGHTYYGLDVTNPRFEEYLEEVISTFIHKWGFSYLKCDFLFGACLRGGSHKSIDYSRAEVLKYGMEIIRRAAGKEVFILGCGMPLSAGIGTVDGMRIGPDTGPYWIQGPGRLLRSGSMVGVRNSIRNTFVRQGSHKQFYLNDPDCVMLREKKTKLTPEERFSQINAIILSGGLLFFSDDLSQLSDNNFEEMVRIDQHSRECFNGTTIPLDLMQKEIPNIIYNTSGYLGFFNTNGQNRELSFDLNTLPGKAVRPEKLEEVWSGEIISVPSNGRLTIEDLGSHSSKLFRMLV
jgi:alpha-galactosidase